MSKPYSISVGFTTSYDDKTTSATVKVRDSDGLNINSTKTGKAEDTDTIFDDLFRDVTSQVLNRSKPKEPKLEELTPEQLVAKVKELQAENAALAKKHADVKDENNSLKIDSNVLKLRLDKLQKAYDAQAKQSRCPTKPGVKDDANVKPKACNCGTSGNDRYAEAIDRMFKMLDRF